MVAFVGERVREWKTHMCGIISVFCVDSLRLQVIKRDLGQGLAFQFAGKFLCWVVGPW